MKINIFFIFITLLCCFLFSAACFAGKHEERVGNSTDVINEIMGIPKKISRLSMQEEKNFFLSRVILSITKAPYRMLQKSSGQKSFCNKANIVIIPLRWITSKIKPYPHYAR